MVKINVRKYYEVPPAGFKVAEFEICGKFRNLIGRKYHVVTHRDAIPAVLDHGVGEIPVGNHQKGFRDPEEASDYFQFCCWRLQQPHPAVDTVSRHTE